jgi:hypothetical protein
MSPFNVWIFFSIGLLSGPIISLLRGKPVTFEYAIFGSYCVGWTMLSVNYGWIVPAICK